MNRRSVLTGGGLIAAASVAAPAIAVAGDSRERTAFVLAHGSWHGAWCWSAVEKVLNSAGHPTVAIDLPGHGLNAVLPKSYIEQPFDVAAFASEVSFIAPIGINEFADAVIAGADRALAIGASRVIAVGHSMGGTPITFAAAKAPDKFTGLVYVGALAPAPGKPSGAYLGSEEQVNHSKEHGGSELFLADPAVVGALRINPRSVDPAYRAVAKEALFADVDDTLLETVLSLLTPDAPASIYGELTQFPDSYAAINRTFICCTQDNLLHASVCEAQVRDMNAGWSSNPTKLVHLEASHEAMFSKPAELAALIASTA